MLAYESGEHRSHGMARAYLDTALMSDDPFIALRTRAYDLADTGRFKCWDDIAYAMQAEGFASELITRLNQDGLAVMMITRCCDMARSRRN